MLACAGGPERIDRLRIIAHHRQPCSAGGHAFEDVGLQRIGILVLVDQDVVEHALECSGRVGILQQRPPAQEQVVIVEQLSSPLTFDVAGEDDPHVVALFDAPRKRPLQHIVQWFSCVHAAAHHIDKCFLTGPPPIRAIAGYEFVPHHGHEVCRITGVEHGERRLQPERHAEAPQQPVGHGVERATPHCGRYRLARGNLGPMQQLGRGSSTECQQQNPLRGDAGINQVREPCRERRRLSGAGAGHNQQVPPVVIDRSLLLRIQCVEHAFDISRWTSAHPGRPSNYAPLTLQPAP